MNWRIAIVRLPVLLLAALLVACHTTVLIELIQTPDPLTGFECFQSIVRGAIVVSLVAVVFERQYALWLMWLSVSLLIATQFAALFGFVSMAAVDDRSGFSLLRGFIVPCVITAICALHRSTIPSDD